VNNFAPFLHNLLLSPAAASDEHFNASTSDRKLFASRLYFRR
jgi:hypothetical protein